IPAFDRSGKANQGALLETAVAIELERRGCETGYVATPEGFEVDFLAADRSGERALIQVAADLSDPTVRDREFRALKDAMPSHRGAKALLLTLAGTDVLAAQSDAPPGVILRTVWEWMLGA